MESKELQQVFHPARFPEETQEEYRVRNRQQKSILKWSRTGDFIFKAVTYRAVTSADVQSVEASDNNLYEGLPIGDMIKVRHGSYENPQKNSFREKGKRKSIVRQLRRAKAKIRAQRPGI